MLKTTGRCLIGTREAAEILEVSQGRVRQLVLAGTLWSQHLAGALVLDKQDVETHHKKLQRLRRQGKVRGKQPGGFAPDRPGNKKKAS